MALKFGTFMASFHCPVGQDPTYAIERDLAVLKHMDMLGFEEAWIGEHHSCGQGLIPDPFISGLFTGAMRAAEASRPSSPARQRKTRSAA